MWKWLIIIASIIFLFSPGVSSAASLIIEPGNGTFVVGSTFSVSIYLNSEGRSVNAMDVALQFPASRLQVVSPSIGNSIIDIWTSQPKFDNKNGTILFQGGIPGGINASKGLLATVNFRVTSVGSGIIKFAPESKILANDGKGTDVLEQTRNSVYRLVLPPPLGPAVTSPTHPEEDIWSSNSNVIFEWASEEKVNGYSFILNDSPTDTPDDISEGDKSSISYKNLSDGRYYFHIKSLRDGAWGGVSHFSVKIDSTPPASFPIEITPSVKTARQQPIIQFGTSDSMSGIERYEIKLIPLQGEDARNQFLFIDAESPYIPERLEFGSYDIVVRAYDSAGNLREVTQRLRIVPALFSFIKGDGIEFKSTLTIPWWIIFIVLLALLSILIYGVVHMRYWHRGIDMARSNKILPPEVEEQLQELKTYRNKYGFIRAAIVLVLVFSPFLNASAQEWVKVSDSTLNPPIITSVSRSISNNEIFYAGGEVEESNALVILHLQNIQTFETKSFTIQASEVGDWFYRHNGFLSPGEYLMWSQTKVDDALSPPSANIKMIVSKTALALGSSRLSYESLYLLMALTFLAGILMLSGFIIFHSLKIRRKRKLMLKEIKDIEESMQRGFAILRQDIRAELSLIRERSEFGISPRERIKAKQLMEDLENIEKRTGKEIWDLERLEQAI